MPRKESDGGGRNSCTDKAHLTILELKHWDTRDNTILTIDINTGKLTNVLDREVNQTQK